MYRTSETDTERVLCIEKILEDIPGGGVVDPDDFKTTTTTMLEGTVLGKDANGIYHVFKTAKLQANAADDATDYRVIKGHEFVVGDVIVDSGLAGASQTITAITTTEDDYDTLTVGTTLGHAIVAGESIVQSTEEAVAGAATLYVTPAGIATNSVDLTKDNQGCGIMIRGTVNESLLPYPIDTLVKAYLKDERAYIIFK